MPPLERLQPPQGLDPLALAGHGPAPPALVGGDDDVHKSLEEVTLLIRARAPRGLERLVGFEELSSPPELEAVLV
jgi:hypothetical protein